VQGLDVSEEVKVFFTSGVRHEDADLEWCSTAKYSHQSWIIFTANVHVEGDCLDSCLFSNRVS